MDTIRTARGVEPSRPLRTFLGVCALVTLAGAVTLPSCAWDGQLSILGYTTRPNYDCRYKSVRVPIFKNKTWWTVTPVPGLEQDLTQAVVREIEQKTPYKVKQEGADTELRGTITGFFKGILNYNQINYAREVETTMTVELYWIDLGTGEVISKQARRAFQDRDLENRRPLLAVPDNPPLGAPGRPSAAPVVSAPTLAGEGVASAPPLPEDDRTGTPKRPLPPPIVIRSVGYFRPELGQSITTAMQENVDRMAVQIISAMESGW